MLTSTCRRVVEDTRQRHQCCRLPAIPSFRSFVVVPPTNAYRLEWIILVLWSPCAYTLTSMLGLPNSVSHTRASSGIPLRYTSRHVAIRFDSYTTLISRTMLVLGYIYSIIHSIDVAINTNLQDIEADNSQSRR